jgi:4-hydroxy-tetrahydrodipicolinate synthase
VSTVFVISITTFTADGALDEAALRAHLRRMADGGVGVYVAGSGSGEGYSLSPAERDRVFEITAEELLGRTPARAMGVEPRSAAEMLALAAAAAAAGLDAVQVYSLDLGHGHLPTPQEVERYLRDVLGAAEIPVVVSTHQSAGYGVAPPLLTSLAAEHPHLIGVNCTHPDLGYLADVIDAVAGRDVHVGGPSQALSAMALGAAGYLTSEANLSPALCRRVVDAFEAGELAAAADAYAKVVRLSSLLYGHGGTRATKAVLNALGLPGGYPRPPQLPVSPAEAAGLLERIRSLGAA